MTEHDTYNSLLGNYNRASGFYDKAIDAQRSEDFRLEEIKNTNKIIHFLTNTYHGVARHFDGSGSPAFYDEYIELKAAKKREIKLRKQDPDHYKELDKKLTAGGSDGAADYFSSIRKRIKDNQPRMKKNNKRAKKLFTIQNEAFRLLGVVLGAGVAAHFLLPPAVEAFKVATALLTTAVAPALVTPLAIAGIVAVGIPSAFLVGKATQKLFNHIIGRKNNSYRLYNNNLISNKVRNQKTPTPDVLTRKVKRASPDFPPVGEQFEAKANRNPTTKPSTPADNPPSNEKKYTSIKDLPPADPIAIYEEYGV